MSDVPDAVRDLIPAVPEYCLEQDPMYRTDRSYGPGHPFCSPAHEEHERKLLERVEIEAFIRREVAYRKQRAEAEAA